jgi:hypothetical protein
MKMKSVILIGMAAATCAIAGLLISWNFSPREIVSQPSAQTVGGTAANATSAVIKPRAMPSLLETTNARTPGAQDLALNLDAQPGPNAAVPAAKEPLTDPIAREALTLVGADPEAEAYWFAAINDLSLPANERQDLIEDLNEEGLLDPKHPTIDDLPLILNRLALIEAVGPDAADEVNADAFLEAYKDLINLAELAMGGGKPVK